MIKVQKGRARALLTDSNPAREVSEVDKKSSLMRIPEAGEKSLRIELILAGLVMGVMTFLPFVGYTYKKARYTLSGMSLISGKTICGGKVVLTPSVPVILMLVAAVAIILAGVLCSVFSADKGMLIAAAASIVSLACNMFFASSISGQISKGKNITVSVGSIIALICGFLVLIWTLWALWKMKVLSALDFMAVPGMLYFFINNYIPMAGIMIAFKKIDYSVGIFKSPWNGLNNFKPLFVSASGGILASDAFKITKNTLLYNIAFIVLGIIVGVVVGICLSDIMSSILQKFFQTSILLPQLISYVIVAYIVYAFFSNDAGLVNHVLGTNINFYSEPKYWPFVLIFINIWKMAGYNGIIFLSSIVGIDKSIYEAASIDGATRWQKIKFITLPLLKPTIMTLFMLQVGRIMYSDFGLFYQVPLDSGALRSVTDTIDTYVYRFLMTMNNIGVSSAASTYQAIVGFILVMVVNSIVRRVDEQNALF